MTHKAGEPKLGWKDSVLILAVIAALCATVYVQAAQAAEPEREVARLLEQAARRYARADYAGARTLFERATQRDPGSIAAWRGLGWSLWQLGERDRALALWSDIARVQPRDAGTMLALAQAYESREQWDEALDYYSRALRARPGQAAAHYARGRILHEQGRHAEADRELRRAVALKPADFEAQFLLAQNLKARGRQADASAIFARLARQPVQPRYFRPMADVLLEVDRPAEALSYYRRNLEANPGNRGTILGMARAHARLQDYEPALALLGDYVASHADDGKAREELARIAIAAGRFALAVEHLQLIVRRHPGDLAWQLTLARALRDAGRLDDAARTAQGILAVDRAHVGALEVMLHLALLRGTREDRVQRLEDLAAADPAPRRLIRLGNEWLRLGEDYARRSLEGPAQAARRKAATVFERAMQLDPLEADAVLGAASALRLAGEPRRAIALAQGVTERHPNVERAWRELYEAHASLGELDRAEQAMSAWLRQSPGSVRLRHDLVRTRFRRGERDRAIRELHELLDAPIRGGVPVLLYHGISEASPGDDSMPLRNFRDQMLALKREGYTAIDVHQLIAHYRAGAPLPQKPVLITFDDARGDSFRYADPVLAEVGYRATMFTPVAEVGRHGDYNAVWRVIRRMYRTGRWDIQCHGYAAHALIPVDASGRQGAFLANRMWLASERRLETHEEFAARIEGDYRRCADTLKRELPGLKIAGYAYPFGERGQKAMTNEPRAAEVNAALVRRYFEVGFVVDPAFGMTRMSSPAALERFEVPWDFSGADLLRELRRMDAHTATQLLLADLYSWDNRYAAAESLLADIERDGRGESVALLTRRGRMGLWQGDFATARHYLASAMTLSADHPLALQGYRQLDQRTRPRISVDGDAQEDNRDRDSLSVGPGQRVHVSDRAVVNVGYRYRRYADESFDAARIDPAASGPVALRAVGSELEGELVYRWNWRTALSFGAGIAEFEDESSQPMFRAPERFTLASAALDLPLGERADVSLRGKRGYVGAAGAILDHLGATGGEGRLQWRPWRGGNLESRYGHLRYDDGNARDTASASLMQRLFDAPALHFGYRFRFDDAREENPFFYTPEGYMGHDAILKLEAEAFGRWRFGGEAAFGYGRERRGDYQPQASLLAGLRYDVADRFSAYLNGGRSEAADFRSVQVLGGMALTF